MKMLITLVPHMVYSNPNLQLRLFCVRQSAYISAYGSIMLKSLGPAFVWNLFQNSYVETLSSATPNIAFNLNTLGFILASKRSTWVVHITVKK